MHSWQAERWDKSDNIVELPDDVAGRYEAFADGVLRLGTWKRAIPTVEAKGRIVNHEVESQCYNQPTISHVTIVSMIPQSFRPVPAKMSRGQYMNTNSGTETHLASSIRSGVHGLA